MALLPVLPPGWPAPRGHAHGLIGAGRLLVLGGQIGADTHGRLAQGFLAQAGLALRNLRAVLEAAGGGPEHLARLNWYVTDMRDYRDAFATLGPVWREAMGAHYPAMTVLQVGALVEPEARVEIEGLAILPGEA